ncbi:hypothetical protein CPB86DRAFT_806545 [Serendipita vermifera]|nr:hypothetical protein CPB86DRAFT_806545 [Serendipita vermifera]
MEPGQQIPEYQAQNAHYGTFQQNPNLSYPIHDSSSHRSGQLPISSVYPPAVSGGPYAPSLYNTPPVPPQLFSAPSHMRASPPIAHTATILDPHLPEEVRQAMQAAYDSVEWANGDNVPSEILMPTVKKLGRDSWECRICHKEHKRRDHTVTHVRTAHLDNKGFRCTFENCDSAFGRKGDLERHVSSTHQASFSDTCPHCNSQLHRKDNLARHMRSCKKAPQVGVYQQGYHEHSSHYNTSDQASSSSRSRRNDASAYSHYPRGYTSTDPYTMVRHDPPEGHGHILAFPSAVHVST